MSGRVVLARWMRRQLRVVRFAAARPFVGHVGKCSSQWTRNILFDRFERDAVLISYARHKTPSGTSWLRGAKESATTQDSRVFSYLILPVGICLVSLLTGAHDGSLFRYARRAAATIRFLHHLPDNPPSVSLLRPYFASASSFDLLIPLSHLFAISTVYPKIRRASRLPALVIEPNRCLVSPELRQPGVNPQKFARLAPRSKRSIPSDSRQPSAKLLNALAPGIVAITLAAACFDCCCSISAFCAFRCSSCSSQL